MASKNPPPWRAHAEGRPSRPPPSTVPAKRSADTQEAAWIADEDRFVLNQAKKKAAIRVKAGRARPIDWLAVTLCLIDQSKEDLDEDDEDQDLEVIDPEGVFEELEDSQLADLEKDIDTYIALESSRGNLDYWNTMKIICKDRRLKLQNTAPEARGVSSVTADVDRILSPKTYEELEALENQIRRKLDSNEPIDVDYWEHLLRSLLVWKAKAKLRKVSQAIVNSRLETLRKQQQDEAISVKNKLESILGSHPRGEVALNGLSHAEEPPTKVTYDQSLDPEPSLKLHSEDKSLEQLDEKTFLERISEERRKISKLGYIPMRQQKTAETSTTTLSVRPHDTSQSTSRFAASKNDDFSQATTALYEREVARGVNEDEEIFAGEEEVTTASKVQWSGKYRPRKPRYFNRVQMGYEWNKYNQTHYDHENPPPKVVQGYKFNIFYPDLIDKTKAPTYRIEREGGRKRGQSFAPAGEEDTCLIRFIAGPPYEDIAFRIVDKEWDFSSRRDRGFKSSFDKVSEIEEEKNTYAIRRHSSLK
ncbi:hypothetical protein M501DRAFT_1010111 [Patellaria atrata CBS 101060]|uniref:Splicing factor Cactin n=1 Tax=Patellaria atrata CBS 101060 TaxID=1346257 RepID=A0A9P4VRG4_9PEZI|nr:hypothetical protein M501DRAFT_1010111 [Patellaria atrata CBS 101060]